MLVAFEGIDGSGKSTVARRVASRLRRGGVPVALTREPTPTWVGRAVRRGIRSDLDPLALAALFVADRAHHTPELRRLLGSGHTVLVDRYADSTTAYQAAALAGRVRHPLASLRDLQAGLFPRPDRVVLLDLPPRVAIGRIGHRRIRESFEEERFLRRVRANYRRLALDEPSRWLVLDAARPLHETVDAVARDLASRGPRRRSRRPA